MEGQVKGGGDKKEVSVQYLTGPNKQSRAFISFAQQPPPPSPPPQGPQAQPQADDLKPDIKPKKDIKPSFFGTLSE